jgi:hypothetical protein
MGAQSNGPIGWMHPFPTLQGAGWPAGSGDMPIWWATFYILSRWVHSFPWLVNMALKSLQKP